MVLDRNNGATNLALFAQLNLSANTDFKRLLQ